jgi:MerR family transcriptional regulator/heat shock protein HspR
MPGPLASSRTPAEPPTAEPVVEGVYVISVAARILDMHPQTLRKYERLGLINPGRSVGMLRLYSWEDIRKLYLIRHLVENLGFNLAGVEFTLALVDQLLQMKDRLDALAQGTPLEGRMERELAHLFHTLNLPLDSGSI